MTDLASTRRLGSAALANLERHRRRINALNVYPVPDGDTGTNLTLTVRGIVDAMERSQAETAKELAAEVHARDEASGEEAVAAVLAAYELGDEPPREHPILLDVVS